MRPLETILTDSWTPLATVRQRGGTTPYGKFTDFWFEPDDDGNTLALWTIEPTLVDLQNVAVFIFKGDEFLATVEADAGPYAISVESLNAYRTQFDFRLFSRSGYHQTYPWVRARNLRSQARIDYTLLTGGELGDAVKVNFYKNVDGENEVSLSNRIGSLATIRPTIDSAVAGAVSGNSLYLSGRWLNEIDRAGTFEIAVTTSGGPGTGIVTATYGDQTRELTIQTQAQTILNGVRIWFDDAVYQYGDEWTIRFGPPETFTT